MGGLRNYLLGLVKNCIVDVEMYMIDCKCKMADDNKYDMIL